MAPAASRPEATRQFLDQHPAAAVKERTLQTYRDGGRWPWRWLTGRCLRPCTSDDGDDYIVEYKNDEQWQRQHRNGPLSLSEFTTLLACVEFFFLSLIHI